MHVLSNTNFYELKSMNFGVRCDKWGWGNQIMTVGEASANKEGSRVTATHDSKSTPPDCSHHCHLIPFNWWTMKYNRSCSFCVLYTLGYYILFFLNIGIWYNKQTKKTKGPSWPAGPTLPIQVKNYFIEWKTFFAVLNFKFHSLIHYFSLYYYFSCMCILCPF